MTEPEATPRAGAIKPDPTQMHVVHCAKCGRAMGECRLLPGTLNRYRCKRCGEWTWLVGVAAVTAPGVDVEAQTA